MLKPYVKQCAVFMVLLLLKWRWLYVLLVMLAFLAVRLCSLPALRLVARLLGKKRTIEQTIDWRLRSRSIAIGVMAWAACLRR